MPPITRGNFLTPTNLSRLQTENLKYSYPFNLNLKPGDPFHDKLRDRILDYAQESRNIMARRFDDWREIDRTMTAYIPLSDAEKEIKRNDSRKPVSIVVPLSYASLQVLLTYLTAAFIEFPFFKYDPVGGPEDMLKAIMMEHHISYQVRKKSLGLNMHTMWQDGYKYGVGPMACSWRRDARKISSVENRKNIFGRTREIEIADEVVLYEGNVLHNIDPYEWMPDVNFPTHDIDAHEFDAWFERFNYQRLLDLEVSQPEEFFNVKYLEHIDGRSSLLRYDDKDAREDKTQIGKRENTMYAKPIDVIVCYIDLVPAAWDLGGGKNVETWVFKIAGDQVIIDAGPTNLSHGMKPVVCCAPDFDGHSISNVSRMEVGYGMNEAINFLYNSHITNLRKSINNMLIVDPGLANYNDVIDTREGAVIRMRKQVWGLGKINEAVAQIPVNDVTSDYIGKISMLKQINDQVMGSQDAISGMISGKKERVSSTESRQASSAALSRLEHDAKIIWMQAHNPLAIMMAEHTAQNITEESWFRIIGDLPKDIVEELNLDSKFLRVKPEDLRGFTGDVLPTDGTVPGSHRDPQGLNQFFQSLMAMPPEVLQQFDIVDIVKTMARRQGIKEVGNWARQAPQVQAQVLPDEEVAERASNGDLAPIGEF